MDRPSCSRRGALAGLGGLGAAALAGCQSLFQRETTREPPVVEDRPDTVYLPSHAEGMEMIGMSETGDRSVGLMYSYAHRFWTVTGTETEQTGPGDNDVHLMASVWDPESGTVLPVESGMTIEIEQGDTLVASRAPWPMLSQNMGFHFGDNFKLVGDETYQVTVEVPGLSTDLVGELDGRFEETVTAEFEWEYSADQRDEIPFRTLDDAGDQGALDPMDMMMPLSVAPAEDEMPGRVVGTGTSGDAEFVAAARSTDDGEYLAVSPRTPYNRFVVPMLSLSASVTRDGSAVYDDSLRAAVGPDLGYHYAASLDAVESGDEVTITVDSPPQVSRHEGYETAFIDMSPVSFTVE